MAGGDSGGIFGLLDLIEEHPGALAYDWRTRFGQPLDDIGVTMTWGEAVRLTLVLMGDFSSQTGAAVAGWSFPLTRAEIVAMDTAELEHAVATGARKTRRLYPRPWPDQTKTVAKPTVSQDVVIEALRKAGHTMPLPGAA